MQKRRSHLLFFIIITLLIGMFSLVTTVFAQTNYTSGNTISLAKEQVVNEDYFVAGNTVILDGTVNGDTYVAGGNVVINGTVNGDVLVAGGNISINGRVSGNVRAIGGQIAISGVVGRNVTTAGGSVSIQNPAKIAGSVTAATGNLSLLAPIGKGATIAGSHVSIDSSIGGNVTGAIERLDVLPDATISGKLTYWSNNQASIANATVKNGIIYHHTNWQTQQSQEQINRNAAAIGTFTGFAIIWAIISLLTSFIIGLLLLYFIPIYLQNIYTTVTTKPFLSLGIGFLTVILMPIACITLLITVIGIPVAVILLFSFIIFAILNNIFISYTIGKKLLPQKNVLALLIGLCIYAILSLIPVIGWIWNILTFFVGIGAVVIVEKQLYLVLREKKIM